MRKVIVYIICLLFVISYISSYIAGLYSFQIIFGMLTFLILPGYIFLELNNTRLNYYKKFIFSMGMSLFFLMVGSLAIDQFLYIMGVKKPLNSLYFPLIFIFVISLSILYLVIKNLHEKVNLNYNGVLNLNEMFFLVISLSLLIFTIYSSLYVRIYNINHFLILSYISTCILFAAIVFNNKISYNKYPILLAILGLCLLIPTSIRYNFIIGVDIFREYQMYQHISIRGHWSLINDGNLMTSLGINFFPVIIKRLTGLSGMAVFRYIIPVIFSTTVLSVYNVASNFLDHKKSFISAFLYCCTPYYLIAIYSPRTVLAVFFCSLAVLTLILEKEYRKTIIFFIFFSFGIILTHYSTAYIFLFTLIFLLVMKLFDEKVVSKNKKNILRIKYSHLVLYALFIYMWLGLITRNALESGTSLLYNSFLGFIQGTTDEATIGTGGRGLGMIIPRYIELFSAWAIMLLVFIGVLFLFKKWLSRDINKNEKSHLYYILGGSVILAFLLLPIINTSYDFARTQIYTMIFLSSSCVLGVFVIFKNKQNLGKVFVLCIIGLFLFSYSGVSYQLMGYQKGYALITEGDVYLENDITLSDYNSARWLDKNREKEFDIYTTEITETRRLDIAFKPSEDRFEYVKNRTHHLPKDSSVENFTGYLYLYRANVEFDKRLSYSSDSRRLVYREFTRKEELVNNSDMIYSNGHSIILKSS